MLDGLPADGETDAGALLAFCGEPVIETFLEDFFRHATTVVGENNPYCFAAGLKRSGYAYFSIGDAL